MDEAKVESDSLQHRNRQLQLWAFSLARLGIDLSLFCLLLPT